MRREKSGWMLIVGIIFLGSCSNTNDHIKVGNSSEINKVLQQEDGSISLHVKKAECYSDKVNPSSNTAEWNVVVSKSGRFNVWLASATTDTNNLEYNNTVLLSVEDNRLEAQPSNHKVVKNSSEVNYPYFRADSFMGSLYIQDTGLFEVQIISDKIIPEDKINSAASAGERTKLLSVFLTPVVR
jgi:hypothetical protein